MQEERAKHGHFHVKRNCAIIWDNRTLVLFAAARCVQSLRNCFPPSLSHTTKSHENDQNRSPLTFCVRSRFYDDGRSDPGRMKAISRDKRGKFFTSGGAFIIMRARRRGLNVNKMDNNWIVLLPVKNTTYENVCEIRDKLFCGHLVIIGGKKGVENVLSRLF